VKIEVAKVTQVIEVAATDEQAKVELATVQA